jgi:hypothetical protein
MPSTIHIGESLAVAAVALRPITPLPPVQDPLRLNMPPLGYPATGSQPDPASLRVLGALYLYAETEQAGMIPVAEVIALNRATLPIQDARAAGKVEAFAQKMQRWYDRQHRGMLFARLFGLGEAATNDQGVLVNRDFERTLGAFCLAIVAYAGAGPFTFHTGSDTAHLASAALDLLSNLGGRQFGNTLPAAQNIHDELLAAIDVLNDRGMQASLQARDMWDLLAKVIGEGAPDFGRLIHRGQTGQRLMEWLANVLSQLSGLGAPPTPSTAVVTWAAEWLDANGLLHPAGAAA